MTTSRKQPVDPMLYRLLVEQAKDYALFLLDPTGHVMSWNPGAERLKGYAEDEIVGRHFSVFYTADAIARRWPAYELAAATTEGHFEDEGWRVRKDGSRFWANVVITALRDPNGKLLGFSKITRDLSERKQQEEALRESEERFRLLVEGVVDYAIFLLDTEGLVTSWNAGAERIHGFDRDEVLGKHIARFFPADDIATGKPWEELARARRQGHTESEAWRVRKNGERFWARVVVSALYDTTGRLRGFAKVTQDLSARRHLQDLEQATRRTNEFIATLAHELRNPLAPIRAAVQVMALAHPHDPAQESLRQTIDRQSALLAHIVDDMIDIARITRGAVVIEHVPVDLVEAARRAVETSKPLLDAASHALHVELPDGAVPVVGDLHRLTQLVTNLLNNAARYTQQGGQIALLVGTEGQDAVLRVRDNGRGIEPELMERVFDMFVQGQAPLERVGAGLGIGLALSRKIAEMHGGTLVAESAGAGRGSEFTLRLPLVEGSRTEAQDQDGAVVPSQVGQRVLVVDDNVDAASTLAMLLESLGHETRVVHDGASALRAVVEFRPQTVLLDIGLPDIDGYEVARRLRAIHGLDRLRIVAISGWGQPADRERSRDAGFDLHLVKPVETAELSRALDAAENGTVH
jgi:PAS domain S-box-containing protein